MRAAIFGTLAVTAGFALAHLHIMVTAAPAPVVVEPRPERLDPPRLDDQVTRAMIRSTIQAELRPQLPTNGTATEVPPPTQRQIDARREAESLINAAIVRGRWRDEDRDQLDLVTRELTGAERNEITRPFVMAVNEQRIQLDVAGPIF